MNTGMRQQALRTREAMQTYASKTHSQRTKLFFAEARLFENFPKGSGRQCAGMHGYVSLPPVWVPQNFVASGLPCVYKASTKEFCQDLTGGIRYQGFRRGRSEISPRWAQARREPFSLQSRLQSVPLRQRALPQRRCRALSNRAPGHGHSSNPEIRARSQVRETRSSA